MATGAYHINHPDTFNVGIILIYGLAGLAIVNALLKVQESNKSFQFEKSLDGIMELLQKTSLDKLIRNKYPLGYIIFSLQGEKIIRVNNELVPPSYLGCTLEVTKRQGGGRIIVLRYDSSVLRGESHFGIPTEIEPHQEIYAGIQIGTTAAVIELLDQDIIDDEVWILGFKEFMPPGMPISAQTTK